MQITRTLRNVLMPALLSGAMLATPTAAHAGVFFSVVFAPPAIPVYSQPPMPGDGYIWTPGYWAYGDGGYYWVDGAWVEPPYEGALWTPGYWGYDNGSYLWNAGYWGNAVGFYGGINYGFGYFGTGFYGGYWNGGHFWYNRGYNNFGRGGGFSHVYNQPYGFGPVHPGGQSFARGGFDGQRGSNIGGRSFGGGNVNNGDPDFVNTASNHGFPGSPGNPGQSGGSNQGSFGGNQGSFGGQHGWTGGQANDGDRGSYGGGGTQGVRSPQSTEGFQSYGGGTHGAPSAVQVANGGQRGFAGATSYNGVGRSLGNAPGGPSRGGFAGGNAEPSRGGFAGDGGPRGGGGGGFHGGGGGRR